MFELIMRQLFFLGLHLLQKANIQTKGINIFLALSHEKSLDIKDKCFLNRDFVYFTTKQGMHFKTLLLFCSLLVIFANILQAAFFKLTITKKNFDYQKSLAVHFFLPCPFSFILEELSFDPSYPIRGH